MGEAGIGCMPPTATRDLATGVTVEEVRDPAHRELVGKVITKVDGVSVIGLPFDEVKRMLEPRPLRVQFRSLDGTQDIELLYSQGEKLGLLLAQRTTPDQSFPPNDGPLGSKAGMEGPSSCCGFAGLCQRADDDVD